MPDIPLITRTYIKGIAGLRVYMFGPSSDPLPFLLLFDVIAGSEGGEQFRRPLGPARLNSASPNSSAASPHLFYSKTYPFPCRYGSVLFSSDAESGAMVRREVELRPTKKTVWEV